DGIDFSGEPRRRELGYFDYATRLAAMENAGTWQAAHPWIDLFLPASSAQDLIAATLRELCAEEVEGGYVMTYPLLRDRCRSIFPGLPQEPQLFLFDLLPSFPQARMHLLPAFMANCDRLLSAARAAGATVYPIGFPV